jgi:hypothetical protein
MSCEFVLDMCRRNLAIFDKQTTRGFQRSKFRALIAAQRPYKSTRRHFMTNLTRKEKETSSGSEGGLLTRRTSLAFSPDFRSLFPYAPLDAKVHNPTRVSGDGVNERWTTRAEEERSKKEKNEARWRVS